MNYKHDLVCLAALTLPLGQAALGQTIRAATALSQASLAPTVTILSAATGALLRSQGTSSASLDLGRVSYFKGTSAPGETRQLNPNSFVISTRFALKVDCPGSPQSTKVSVTMSRADAAASYTIRIDGTPLRQTVQILMQSMSCGSAGEHRLDMEVPVSTPAGPVASLVAFVAVLIR